MNPAPKLALSDVVVQRSGRLILDVPALDIKANETLTVLGPNGAGKSTLLQVLALLERPTSGIVMFDGEDATGDPLSYRRRMAVVFQEALLLATSVEGNVRSGMRLRGISSRDQERRAAEWLDRLGIRDLALRSNRYLSGGEAQRTSLARAFALEPEVLLLDEPFGALDSPTRSSLIDDLARILDEAHITTVLVTHDRSEALRLGDRVAVLIDGHIRQIGNPQEVFSAPADEDIAAFVGVETIIPARVKSIDGGVAALDVAGVPLEVAVSSDVGENVLLCLRPEDVVVARLTEATAPTSARNHIAATVTRISTAGPHARVELNGGFPLVALITKQSLEDLGLEPGTRVHATFKATAAHLIPHRLTQ